MTDSSFRRLGSACAFAFAICTLAYALLVFLDSEAIGFAARLADTVRVRGINQPANFLLGCAGILATIAVAAVYELIRERGGAWARWAVGVGIVGAAMSAAHGFWDYLRVPLLLEQWDSANPASRAAISTFSGQPNPVDPRGLGAFLFLGAFVLVAARLMGRQGSGHALAIPIGLVYGALMIASFAAGFVGPEATRAGLAALSIGVAGPIWWLLAANALWRSAGDDSPDRW